MEIYRCPTITAQEDAALDRIAEIQHEMRFYVSEPRRWLGAVRKVLAARSIQGSNSIEGLNVSAEDAVAAIEGQELDETNEQSRLATEGNRRAMTYVLQLARDEDFAYTRSTLRSLHFMMTEYDLDARPGLWRAGPIYVYNESSGERLYEGPEADTLPDLTAALMQQLNSEAVDVDQNVIVRAAMAHLNLVMIHPFRDGNGRMARCLQSLVLTRAKILVPEFCSIEEYLGHNTQSYYDILSEVGEGSWNPSNDARPWLRYCLEAHYIQAASVLRRIRESEEIWGYLEDAIQAARLNERSIQGLFYASLGLRVTNSSYRSALKSAGEEVSNQVATMDLNQLVSAGLLEKHGTKRGSYYLGAQHILEFRAALRSRREPITTTHLFDTDRTLF